jgi:hypothetical protein
MLIVLVCFNLILAYSFVFLFSNSFLYSCHAQQDPTGHVSTLDLLTKVTNWVQTMPKQQLTQKKMSHPPWSTLLKQQQKTITLTTTAAP